MNLKVLGAAVIMASAVVNPAMAQQVTTDPGRCINCKNLGPRHTSTAYHHRRMAHRPIRRDWERRPYRTGFWPGDVAAGIVGGAIGTAGAIATAPFRAADAFARSNANAYAWDSGYYGWPGWNNSYAARNGFVCTPATYFRGADGRRYLCQ